MLSVVATGLTPPSLAVAVIESDLAVTLDLANLVDFVDSQGNSISIVSDETVGAERTVVGTETSGVPVAIRIYLGAAATKTTAAATTDLYSLGLSRGPDGSDINPPSDTSPAPFDSASLRATIAVATTPSTATVTWLPPVGADHFSLLVGGETVAQGNAANFSLVGLEPEQSLSLQMVSSHTTPAVVAADPAKPPVTGVCPAPTGVFTSTLDSLNLTESRSAGHSSLVMGGLRVFTDDSSSDAKAAGYLATSVKLSDVGVASLDWQGSAIRPGLQLVTDFNDDGVPDGILVGELAYGDDYWASNGSAQFVRDGAPDHTSGSGSLNHGLLPECSSSFPNAKVLAIGYSLGSGVQGDGIITALTVACTEYTFGFATVPTPASQTADQTSFLSVSTLKAPGANQTAPTSKKALQVVAKALTSLQSTIHSTEFQYRTFIPYFAINDSPAPDDRIVERACLALAGYGPRLPPLSPNDYYFTFMGDDRNSNSQTLPTRTITAR